MTPNERIRKRREELGLTQAEVAAQAGLGIYAYGDIELHKDEAYTVADLGAMRRICALLGLDLLSLFGVDCASCAGGAVADDFPQLRDRLIAQRREALGLSRAELGDRIGFETGAIDAMESDAAFLEGWSAELIVELAQILGVSAHALLRVRCSKCSRGDQA